MTQNTEKLTKAESSRRNGALSHGPVTEAGKARSCLNRTTHGMRSSRVVLHTESQELYDTLSDRFFHLFLPEDIFEEECVANLVNARWRIRRLEAADTANLNLAIEEARPDFEKKFDNLNADHHNALAYRAIAQTTGNTDIIGRHEDRQHRIFDRSYRLLCRHRGKARPLPSPEALRQAEADLPADNLIQNEPANPLQIQPDSQNQAFDPETPPDPPPNVHLRPLKAAPQPAPAAAAKPERDGNPYIAYPEDFEPVKHIFEALRDRPELRIALSEAIMEYNAKQSNQ